MGGLQSMRNFVFDDYIEKSDEELDVIMSLLSQNNLIKNIFYIPDDYDITSYYWDLRKRTLAWLKACNKKMKNDNQQNTFPIEKFSLLSKITNTNNESSFFQKNITKS